MNVSRRKLFQIPLALLGGYIASKLPKVHAKSTNPVCVKEQYILKHGDPNTCDPLDLVSTEGWKYHYMWIDSNGVYGFHSEENKVKHSIFGKWRTFDGVTGERGTWHYERFI